MADIEQVYAEELSPDAPTEPYVVGEQPSENRRELAVLGQPYQFQPGNQAWKNRKQPVTSALRDALTPEKLAALAERAVDEAIRGNMRAAEFLTFQVEGKPATRIIVESGEDGSPLLLALAALRLPTPAQLPESTNSNTPIDTTD